MHQQAHSQQEEEAEARQHRAAERPCAYPYDGRETKRLRAIPVRADALRTSGLGAHGQRRQVVRSGAGRVVRAGGGEEWTEIGWSLRRAFLVIACSSAEEEPGVL